MTWKNGDTVGLFLRRIGATGALLELEARQVSRALRGDLNRVLNAESANLQRAVGAAGRQIAAIEELTRDGELAAQPYVVRLGRRRPARDAGGDARRAGRAARAPPLGRPAGPRADRAPRAPRRRTRARRRRPGRRRAGAVRTGQVPHAAPSGMIRAMRPVIIAANWKMNTTPADAGELAPTIAAGPASRASTRVICPPFVCLAAVRDALAEATGRRASAPRTSTTSWPARTPATSRAPMLVGLATG